VDKEARGLRTESSKPVTDGLIEEVAAETEAAKILRRSGGRPPMGSAAASVESVRLDPELSRALRDGAEEEGLTNSALIREALRRYLRVS
jgi:Ribbon-helix-helix protein, copG family